MCSECQGKGAGREKGGGGQEEGGVGGTGDAVQTGMGCIELSKLGLSNVSRDVRSSACREEGNQTILREAEWSLQAQAK